MAEYQGVSLPKNLLNLIEAEVSKHGYTNKVDFIREAVREKLERLQEGQ